MPKARKRIIDLSDQLQLLAEFAAYRRAAQAFTSTLPADGPVIRAVVQVETVLGGFVDLIPPQRRSYSLPQPWYPDDASFETRLGRCRSATLALATKAPFGGAEERTAREVTRAIDGLAELVFGRRDHFWNKPHSTPPL